MNQPWDEEFEVWRNSFLDIQSKDTDFKNLSKAWMQKAVERKYSYQFDWLGVPVIQMPGDLVLFQDVVYKQRPDFIIETGIARGGSLIFWASIQKLCGINGKVLGIDIDIRDHAKQAILASDFSQHIQLIQGSSTDHDVYNKVKKIASNFKRVMVVLDSNHTHEHVLSELKLYSEIVSQASPKSAIVEYMKSSRFNFQNIELENKSVLSVAPYGFWLKLE